MGSQLRCVTKSQHTMGGKRSKRMVGIGKSSRKPINNNSSSLSIDSSKTSGQYMYQETYEEGPRTIKKLMDSISDINQDCSFNLDHAYQALYDPNVEANWIELQISSQIFSSENTRHEFVLKVC